MSWRGILGGRMSQENVETVHRAFQLLFLEEDLDAVFREGLAAPDVEWRPSAEVPDAAHYIGPEGVARFIRVWTQDFAEWSVRVDRYIDAGDRVVAFVHQTARGKGSGVPVEQRFGVVLRLSSGVITNVKVYTDRAEAIEAAGLGNRTSLGED
jgi:ketosteroid isomerase-like protein